MPVRVGRRICQLISQSRPLHAKPRFSPNIDFRTTSRCLTSSAITAARHPKPKSKHSQPKPKPNPLRDQLRSLLMTPTNEDTVRKLFQLKRALPTTPEHVCLLAEVLAQHAYVPDALEVLSRARAQGVAIPPAHYEPIAYRLAQQNRWSDMLALLEPVQSLHALSTTNLTTRLCEWRVRACAELGDFAGMERALGKFPHGIPRRAWEVAERACMRNSDPETANRIRQVLKIDGKGEEKGKGKEVGWKTTEEIVRLLVWQPDARGDSSGESSRTVQVSRIGDSRDPKYLITSHITPSSSNEPIISHSFRPTARLATLCVQDLVRDARVKEAATVVASMCKAAPMPDTLSTPTGTSTSKSSPNPAHDTLSLPVVFASIKPDIFVFNALLRGVLDTRGLSGMLVMLEIMQEQGILPNAETGVLLLRYLDRQLAWRPYRLFETLIDLTRPIPSVPGGDRSMPPEPRPIPISIRHTNILLSSILHAERTATLGGGWKASAAFLKYRSRPIDRLTPTDARIGSSPNKSDPPTAGLRFQTRTTRLTRVIRALRSQGVRNDPMAYALRAQRDGVIRLDPEAARNVLQSADFPLGEYHYAALMAGLVECGYMDAAASVMRAAHDAGFGAQEPVMHTILVSGYGRMGLPQEAERVFHEMLEKGIAPDVISVDALAGAWFISGDYQRARNVIIKHWPEKGGLDDGRQASLRDLVVKLRTLRPASKIRKKRMGEVSKEDLGYVERIIEAIKAPDKVLSPASNEKKDTPKSNTRRFSSVAGTWDETNGCEDQSSVDVHGFSRGLDGEKNSERSVVHRKKLRSRARVMSALQ
ncbi:pentatricopeptide repeat-containing protein 5, mitochondrial [Ceratobasidium sp. AG-Ba]|nr:pentatricopeptide repeat-containing protein 5, mitochondrial [Ceratobasidium sp. AG-Ba]